MTEYDDDEWKTVGDYRDEMEEDKNWGLDNE